MSTEGFARLWNATVDGLALTGNKPHPTDALESIFELFYDEAVTQPPNSPRLSAAIGRLLRYLGRGEGHTHDNLRVASGFLAFRGKYWEVDWADLPQPVVELLSRLLLELCDAVEDPKKAEKFGGVIERLLVQLKAYDGSHAG
jgi:hypothetical protein